MKDYWKRIIWLAGSFLTLLPISWMCEMVGIIKINDWCGLLFLVIGASGSVLLSAGLSNWLEGLFYKASQGDKKGEKL